MNETTTHTCQRMTLICNGNTFAYELECVIRLFYPGIRLMVRTFDPGGDVVTASITDSRAEISLRLGNFRKSAFEILNLCASESERERILAVLLYKLLSEHTGIIPPWGILTGVRPVRLCRTWLAQGLTEMDVAVRLQEDYLVKPEKISLALETKRRQEAILSESLERDFSLYVSIPFCPSRCLYCSFVSHEIEKCAKLIPDYLNLLCDELRQIAAIAQSLKLRLRTIYIGGGTPTTLETKSLSILLDTICSHFDISYLLEYTVEAGRPDTINPEKLSVMRKFGVNRISVNPQTMDDLILSGIGRKHTSAMVEKSFLMAREAGFCWINMDLIAGLPGDNGSSLRESIDKVLTLSPENITVHSLTVKRSSALRDTEDPYFATPGLETALAKSHELVRNAGYHPFYLYRQKGTRQNLENVGFAKPGSDSPYNIFIMDEAQTILAAGAGAVTKLCRESGIKRVYNFKFPYEYISRNEEQRKRKSEIIKFFR